MMEILSSKLPALLLGWLGVVYSIYRLFAAASDSTRKETKAQLSRWLQNISIAEREVTLPIKTTLDRIYGEKWVSWRAFFVSGVISVVGVLIFSFFCIVLKKLYRLKNKTGIALQYQR